MTSHLDAVFAQNPIKRKLDDFDDDVPSVVPPAVRMRKDQFSVADFLSRNSPPFSSTAASSSSSPSTSSSPPSSSTRLQFFVRLISGGNTLVIHADSSDLVKSIHEKIQSITGIPVCEQRLIYRGKQLQEEHTLAACGVQNDAGLQLVGRMRSTGHPLAWQLIDDLVSQIFDLCKNHIRFRSANNTVLSRLSEFLSMTPRVEAAHATEHIQILLSSSAPAALVMLYMSPIGNNRRCGEDSIRHFITLSKSALPVAVHLKCAPVVLEFCKLLRRVAGSNDPVYEVCCSSLAYMLQNKGVGNQKELIPQHEVLLFVSELASKLSQGLEVSMESNAIEVPLSSQVHDFVAFMRPIRDAKLQNGLLQDGGHGKMGYDPLCYEKETDFLQGIFVCLLDKMECCLEKMEKELLVKENVEGKPVGWSQYLAILKELNSIARLYDGAEVIFWSKMLKMKDCLCYLIVKYSNRSDDNEWIVDHKEVMNFEARRHLAMMMLPELRDDYEELHEMLIDRSQLLAESFEYIGHADPESLRGGLFMEFKNEEATGPGVLREWFFLVSKAIFNPQNALFVSCPNDRRRFFPNPASKVDPLHLEYFNFSGRVIALSLMHKVQVGIVFDRVFFKQLAGKYICLEDIQDADPYLYSSCKQILEMDPETVDQDTLGLSFVCEVEELGSMKVVELCPSGRSITVNSTNRNQYVDLLIKHRFVTSIAEQVAHFIKGFADIIGSSELQKSFFQSLDLEDLDWILHGSERDVSVDDWKAHTQYNGYKETDAQICWFWEIVGKMSNEQRKVLLFFWTSIRYLPVDGFGGLASRLYIYKTSESYHRLPSSHTCFYRLCFPPYPSMDVMQERLNIITQDHVGSSFGTW